MDVINAVDSQVQYISSEEDLEEVCLIWKYAREVLDILLTFVTDGILSDSMLIPTVYHRLFNCCFLLALTGKLCANTGIQGFAYVRAMVNDRRT